MSDVTTVDEYIAGQSAQAQPRLRELRALIRTVVPDASEVISYGMPTYKRGRQRVHFALARGHYALYGVPIEPFADKLAGFKTSKGTVQFPLDQPLPAELVRALVAAKFAG